MGDDTFNHFDIGAVSICMGILLVYHFHLFYSVFGLRVQGPQMAVNFKNAKKWVLKHKEKSDPASVTLAVQTLRNSILVSTFIGGGVFVNGIDIANSYPNDIVSARMKARAIILSSCMIASFLCWVNVIRFSSHLGYLLGTVSYKIPPSSEPIIKMALDEPQSPVAVPQTEKNEKADELEEEKQQIKQCVRAVKNLLINFRYVLS